MNQIRLTHYFTFCRSLGGVESILRRHLTRDLSSGIESKILAFFEPEQFTSARIGCLGLTWRDCVASARRKFRHALREAQPGVALYHNSWGLPFLADLDKATRRISLIHTDAPNIAQLFASGEGLVDGIMCVSNQLAAQARRSLPLLDASRITVLPYPISAPHQTAHHSPMQNRPVVCGFVGRVIKEQKRVDRLPRLCETLDRNKIDYRFEILGDGPMRKGLEQRFRENPKIVFHGRKEGDAYWQALGGWDAAIFVSDYEGLPISLLEALSQGVLPIYPSIQSGGDPYTAKVRPDLLYPPEDFESVANVLKMLQKTPEQEIRSLREVCRRLAAPHCGDSYERAFAQFVQQIAEWPRISSSEMPPRPFHLSDYCPFAALRRFHYRGFFRRNDDSIRQQL